MQSIKTVIIGDGMVGKTCLICTYVCGHFPGDYFPTIFDNYSHCAMVDGKPYNLNIWDTAGQEDYARLRPLSYHKVDCFLMCYSVSDQTSYQNIVSKWHPEITQYCPEAAIVLIATKLDLREEQDITISRKEGKRLKEKINATTFMECSAKRVYGVMEVFEETIRAATNPPRPERNCAVL